MVLRRSARITHIACPKIRTLQDLLRVMEAETPPQLFAMLKVTANHLANLLKTPIAVLPIDSVLDIQTDFSAHLRLQRYSRNSIRSYRNFLGVLIRSARQLG